MRSILFCLGVTLFSVSEIVAISFSNNKIKEREIIDEENRQRQQDLTNAIRGIELLEYKYDALEQRIRVLEERHKNNSASNNFNSDNVSIDSMIDNIDIPQKDLAVTQVDTTITNDRRLYNNAMSMFKNGELDKAELLFKRIKKEYPKSILCSNVDFWCAEITAKRGDLKSSAGQFIEFYKNNPNSDKALDALLKSAENLYKLGDLTKTCAVLRILDNTPNPKSTEFTKRTREISIKSNCK